MSTAGGEANKSGQILLDVIESEFRKRDFVARDYIDYTDSTDLLAKKVLMRRPPYINLFQERSTNKFLAMFNGRRIRIECFWQDSPGSTDRKLPYVMDNLLHHVPETEAAIVFGGKNVAVGVIGYLRARAAGASHKTIWVLHLDEFPRWAREQIEEPPKDEASQQNMI